MKSVFVLDLEYAVELDAVDAQLAAHRVFLEQNYERGVFLASGPKVPRTGGVILAAASSWDQIEAIVRDDPFHKNGLAIYRITEFEPRMTAPDLELG
ncbi:YciI family protein [Roseibium polysiphoniae]|uniref:GTP cyclohydrolase n=1 Tax=Roseibium polysiphoniae TaxID=2571221 RepID=A0ABR9C6A1_9HYPH|nr:YciI family protein [Roseibium polysiphoniae]MBD8875459.1 GTP cyclohydrolase [Roseibium polysiphoniae]